MAINFENTYVNPNIKIESRDVPLEQLEKTANIIQERYDTSRENYNQAGEALRLLESSANPIDREQAKLLRGQYEDQLNELGKTDEFQKQGWKTKQLAGETAANYNKIVKRNEDIQAKRNEIVKNTKWDLKKAQRLAEFDASMSPITWDAENRTLGNTNVDTYSAANDYNIQESMFKYRTGMNPITIGNKTGRLKFLDANGQVTTPEKSVAQVHVTDDGQVQQLSAEQIQKAVYDAVANDEGFQAAHQRDLNYEFKLGKFKGIDPNSPEGQQATASFLQSELNPKAASIGQLTKVFNKQDGHDEDMSGSPFAALNIGAGQTQNQYDNYSPVDNYTSVGETNQEFPQAFEKAMNKGDHRAKADLLSTLNYMEQNGYPQDAKKLKEYITKYEGFVKQYPEWAEVLNRGTGGRYNNPLGTSFQSIQNMANGLANLIESGMVKSDKAVKELTALKNTWGNYVAQGLFDSGFEKAFQQVTATPAKTRVVPMVAPGLGSAEIQGKIKALNLTQDQFDIEGGWKDDKNNHVEIVSHSVEPIGSGKGIMYTLQDNSGKTYNAFAKKQGYAGVDGQIARTDGELNKNIKYRGVTIPRYTGQKLTFEQIAEDANVPDMAKNYPGYSIITNKDNTYSRVNPQGAVEATAGSVFDLLP